MVALYNSVAETATLSSALAAIPCLFGNFMKLAPLEIWVESIAEPANALLGGAAFVQVDARSAKHLNPGMRWDQLRFLKRQLSLPVSMMSQ